MKPTRAQLEAAAAELRTALAESRERERRLQESEGRVRALLETAGEGILAVGRNGRIVMANRTAENMFGYRQDELLGQPVESLLPGGLRVKHRRLRRGFFAHPETRPMGQGRDLFARRNDGSIFPVEVSLSYFEPKDEMVAVAFVSDITERKKADEARRDSEERFRLAAQCGNDLIYEWDLETNELEWWGEIEAYLGYRLENLEAFEKCLHPQDRERIMAAVERHLNTGDPFDQEYRLKAKNGSYRCWVDQGIARRDKTGKPYRWIGACTDITERKRADQALRRSHQELRSLTARLTAAQEEEYRYLSREMHDVFSQKIAALALAVSDLEGRLAAEGISTKDEIGDIGNQLGELAADIHGFSRRLHPATLDDLGLAPALKNECLAFARDRKTKVRFQATNVPPDVPGDVALCFYRILQESLNNVRRHAGKSRVSVTLSGERDGLRLRIKDSGKGFRRDEVRGRGGVGLVSMEERVRVVNGALRISSSPGAGTEIDVRVPLQQADRGTGIEHEPADGTSRG